MEAVSGCCPVPQKLPSTLSYGFDLPGRVTRRQRGALPGPVPDCTRDDDASAPPGTTMSAPYRGTGASRKSATCNNVQRVSALPGTTMSAPGARPGRHPGTCQCVTVPAPTLPPLQGLPVPVMVLQQQLHRRHPHRGCGRKGQQEVCPHAQREKGKRERARHARADANVARRYRCAAPTRS